MSLRDVTGFPVAVFQLVKMVSSQQKMYCVIEYMKFGSVTNMKLHFRVNFVVTNLIRTKFADGSCSSLIREASVKMLPRFR